MKYLLKIGDILGWGQARTKKRLFPLKNPL